MDSLEIIKNGDYVIKIVQDDNPESPREYDNLGIMACFHDRYVLGDKTDFRDTGELCEFIKKNKSVYLPLYLFEHSGISISCNAERFRAVDSQGWDWGQVGIIYVTYDKLRKEYSRRNITKSFIKQIKKYLIGEVDIYDKYISGECYGYIVEDKSGNFLDSCYGFFDFDECISQANDYVKTLPQQLTLNMEY